MPAPARRAFYHVFVWGFAFCVLIVGGQILAATGGWPLAGLSLATLAPALLASAVSGRVPRPEPAR